MKLFTTKPAPTETSIAEFISSTSSREKKRVYSAVLAKSAASQMNVVAAAQVASTA
jgi:hypothetical protein